MPVLMTRFRLSLAEGVPARQGPRGVAQGSRWRASVPSARRVAGVRVAGSILLVAIMLLSGLLSLPSASAAHLTAPAASAAAADDRSPLGYARVPSYPATANPSMGWQNDSALSTSPHPTGALGAMTYDASDGYVLWFGVQTTGVNTPGMGWIAETWTFRAGHWSNLTPNLTVSPPAIQGAGIAYDAADGYVVLFGGFDGGIPNGSSSHPSVTWEYHAGNWTDLTPTAGTPPPGQYHPAMTYDAASRFVLLAAFARSASGNSTFQTWSFVAGKWSNISGTTGTQPNPREQAGLAYDASDTEAVLFGGTDVIYNAQGPDSNATWVFRSGAWVNVTQDGAAAPIGVADLTMSNTAGGHVVLYGGYNSHCNGAEPASCFTNKTWVFAGEGWNDLSWVLPGAPPGAETDAPMAWDPIDGYGVLLDDDSNTWLLHWNESGPTLALTPPRYGVDLSGSLRFNVAVFGGAAPYNVTLCVGAGTCSNSPWTSLSGLQEWTPMFPTAGNITVYGRAVDANGTVTTAGVTIGVAATSGPLAGTFTVVPRAGESPANLTLWVNVTGGAPPYSISVAFGDLSNGSALDGVPLVHTYYCSGGGPNTLASCEYQIQVSVTDVIGEVWSGPAIMINVCDNPAGSPCYPPPLPPGSASGPLGPLHLSDPRYDGGYVALSLAGGVAGITIRSRRQEAGTDAEVLRQQLEESPAARGPEERPR